MGLILYFKKQYNLLRFYLTRNSLQFRFFYPIICVIRKTPLIMRYVILTQVLYERCLILISSFNLLRFLHTNSPFLFFILGLIFRVFHVVLDLLFCRPVRFRFIVLLMHHFSAFFELILIFRIVIEWFPVMNPNKNPIAEFIYYITDPFFRIFDNIVPGGKASIVAYILFESSLRLMSMWFPLINSFHSHSWHLSPYEYTRFMRKLSKYEFAALSNI